MRFSFKPKAPKAYKPKKDTWFAWRPVKTVQGSWAWLEKVRFETQYDWYSRHHRYYLMGASE